MFWILFLFLAMTFITGRLVFLAIRAIYLRRPRNQNKIIKEVLTRDGMEIHVMKRHVPYNCKLRVVPTMANDSIVHTGDNIFNVILEGKKGRPLETAYFSHYDGVLNLRMTDRGDMIFFGSICQLSTAEG